MAYTEFYMNASTGSNVNAGDNTANGIVTSTNGAWSTVTNIFTATSGTPFSGVTVGDFASLYSDGGTASVYIARVTEVGVGGLTLTLDTTAKAGTAPTTAAVGITCTTGGVWKGPNAASSFPFSLTTIGSLKNVAGNFPRFNMKNNATYNVTAAVTSASAGPYAIEGYTTTVGDGGRFTLDGGTSGASYALLTISGANVSLLSGIIQNNGATGSATGLTVSTGGVEALLFNIVVNNMRGHGFDVDSTLSIVTSCEAYLCNTSNTSLKSGFLLSGDGSIASNCISHNNAGSNSHGFYITDSASVHNCISDTNGGTGLYCNQDKLQSITNCVFYGNASDGVRFANASTQLCYVTNSVFVSNGGWGVNGSGAGSRSGMLKNCAFLSNTSGAATGLSGIVETGSVTLTGDPFTDAANGDFTMNNTAGAGDDCRNAGTGVFTQTQESYTGTVSYPDIGATQQTGTSEKSFTYIG